MPDRPKVVALIGSSRFKARFHEEGFRLEKQGVVAIMMACFQHADGLTMNPEEFDRVHGTDAARIDMADEVLVLNVHQPWCPRCGTFCRYGRKGQRFTSLCCDVDVEQRGYVGDSTRLEIAYARERGKLVRFLNPVPEGA